MLRLMLFKFVCILKRELEILLSTITSSSSSTSGKVRILASAVSGRDASFGFNLSSLYRLCFRALAANLQSKVLIFLSDSSSEHSQGLHFPPALLSSFLLLVVNINFPPHDSSTVSSEPQWHDLTPSALQHLQESFDG